MAIRFKSEPVDTQGHEKNLTTESVASQTGFYPNTIASSPPQVTKSNHQLPTQTSQKFLEQLSQRWNNFNIKTKLIFLLVGSAALPAVLGTAGVVAVGSNRYESQLQSTVQSNLRVLLHELDIQQQSDKEIAIGLAKVVEASELDLKDKEDLKVVRALVKDSSGGEQSFRIITDAHGKTVAQNIQVLGEDFSEFPELPPPEKKPVPLRYHPVSRRIGINLGDIRIVKDALSTGRLMTGYELWGGDDMNHLGLDKQASFGYHSQSFNWLLSSSERPFEEATVFLGTESGNAGLVIAAVQPIHSQGKIVGAAIVGTLLNRNYPIVDGIKRETGVDAVSLFAQDEIVSTNLPDPKQDRRSRAIATRAASGIADPVVNRGENFTGHFNVLQDDFLIAYSPLKDHRQTPIGMAGVGEPQSKEFVALAPLWIAGFGVGGSMLLLVGLVAVPLATNVRERHQSLALFAERLSFGITDSRLDVSSRDEVGELEGTLNYLAQRVEAKQSEIDSQKSLKRLAESQLLDFGRLPDIIRRSLEASDILKSAVNEILSMLNAERVLIYRSSIDQSGTIAAQTSIPESESQALTVEIQAPSEQYPDYFIAKIELDDNSDKFADLVSPITVNHYPFGWLVAYHSMREWSKTEINLFRQAATQIGLAIEQAQMLEQMENARITSELKNLEQRRQKENAQRQLAALLESVNSFSTGDLSVRAEVLDGALGTIADFFNLMIENMHHRVAEIKTGAEQLNNSVEGNAVTSVQLALSIEKQAREISLNLKAVERVSVAIQGIASNLCNAGVIQKNTSDTVAAGVAILERTADAILDFPSSMTQTSDKIQNLSASIEQISKVGFLINQIASSTNVLAINASIEAGRAGEAGQGFAVVAQEISRVATASAEATREIERLVALVQQEATDVVAAIELDKSSALNVVNEVRNASKSLEQILADSSQASQLIESVATSTVTQAEVCTLVVRLMKELALDSEQTSLDYEQLNTSVQQTVELVRQVQGSVGVFKLNVET
jgi:methyl-accepting chemotaxis protein